MRRTLALITETYLLQLNHISKRQPSLQRLSTVSKSPNPRVASPAVARRQLRNSTSKQKKKPRGQVSQGGVLQSSANLQIFTRWLIAGGVEGISGDAQKVEIYQYGEDGRGFRATTDVKDEDVIFSIPLNLLLGCKPGFDAQLGLDLHELTPLAVKLLSERALQQQSPYHPYIQALPESVPSLYGAFPESCHEELQGFVSDPEWEEGRTKPALEYAKISQSPQMAGLTKDDFRWAFSVVSSRAFAGAMNKPGGTQVAWKFLAPLLDMVDHGGLCQVPGEKDPIRLDNVRYELQEAGYRTWRLQACATQGISKGQPLLMRYIADHSSTHYLLHYGFVPTLDPSVELDLFPHMHAVVDWTLSRLYPKSGDMGESERQQLAAEAHMAAREVDLRDTMAAKESGGIAQDSFRKADPLAMKLHPISGHIYGYNRFEAVLDVLIKHRQGSATKMATKMAIRMMLIERMGEILTQPGRTSLDADLQMLARHAAPASRRVYVKCLRIFRAKAAALRNLDIASHFVRDYKCPAKVAEEAGHLDTCTLQAIQLRAAQKMASLDTLVDLLV